MKNFHSRAWRALVWKEARGMTAVSVTFATFFLVLFVLGGEEDSPALRTDWPKLAWIAAIVIGGFHGLMISLPERLGGTREYLIHRSVSRGQIFSAKVVTGLIFALAAWALPLILMSFLSSSESAALSLPEVWLACGALGTNLVSSLGWGAFIGYLIHERSRAFTIWALGMFGLLALGLLEPWPEGAGPLGRAAYLAATHCAIGALCIVSAGHSFAHPTDSDLWPSSKSMAQWLPPLALVLALPMGIFLPNFQLVLREAVLGDYPILAVTGAGELALLDRNSDGSWEKLDTGGQVVETLDKNEFSMRASAPAKWKEIFRASKRSSREKSGAVFVAPKLRLLSQLFYTAVPNLNELGSCDLWLDEERGELVVCHSRPRLVGNPVFVPWPGGMPDRHRMRLKKPNGATFSNQTICEVPAGMDLMRLPMFGGALEKPANEEVLPLLIIDPEDASIFVCRPWKPGNVLKPAPLPGGDRMLEVARGLNPVTSTYGVANLGPWLVRGSLGNYKFESGELVRVQPSEWVFPGDMQPEFAISVGGNDLLQPIVAVSDRAGEVLYTGSFRPNSLLACGAWGLNQLAVLLWPPPLGLRSYMLQGEGRRANSRPLVCEELVGSRRLELLIGTVLLSAYLAMRTRRELLSRGQSKARCALWMSLHALCGPIAFVLYRLLEPKLAQLQVNPRKMPGAVNPKEGSVSA